MIKKNLVHAIAAILLIPPQIQGEKNLRSRRLTQQQPCTILLKILRNEDGTEEEEVDCFMDAADGGNYLKISGPSQTQDLFKEGLRKGELISGQSTMLHRRAYRSEDGELVLPDWDGIETGNGHGPGGVGTGPNSRRLATVTGTKEMLAIRVVAADASTTSDEAFISDSWFGTSGDLINLKSQYSACSMGQLTCNGASKTTSTGVTVVDGTTTITITNSVTGVADGTIRDAVVAAGDATLGTMRTQFDHVMLCLPPGTSGSWIAYAYVNWYLSVYNDQWCNYVSGQMHEIGHNLNLAHAGEGTAQYADQSGMMGYSYGQDEGPEMCFNAAKNWQLGWYSDRHVSVTSSWSGNLYGLADYENTSSNDMIIAQIPASVDGGFDDWYVSFNRKIGINRGTVEGGNQVLVHKRASGTGYAQSWLMAKLSAGGTYNDGPLSITVDTIDLNAAQGFAKVTIGTPSTPAPTRSPVTPAPITPAPTRAPVTPAPTGAPITPAPVTPAPVTPAPITPAPVTPAPTGSPITPAPVTPAPTGAPVTPAPTSSPVTPAPVTPAPTGAPIATCSFNNCGLCSGGGECKAVGCSWAKGVCIGGGGGPPSPNPPSPPSPTTPSPVPPAPVCDIFHCSNCGGGGTCRNAGCSWSQGSCS
jgi:hypothetical protein